MTKRVFLSHSHRDRYSATELEAVLKSNDAETYLDQDNIQAGDILPDRIREGIRWCDVFLLLWSSSAATSKWVGKEWDTAYELRKKVIPYLLDSTSLPVALENLVYIQPDDHDRGDAALLMAVFGRAFVPDPTTLFPGEWRATMDVPGLVQGIYDLTFRANGQIEGSGGLGQGGQAGDIARAAGILEFLNMRYPCHGSWSYNTGTQFLTLNITAVAWGHKNSDTVIIHTTGRERGAIQGRDLQGRSWSFQRKY